MLISSRGRYALRVLVDLAQRREQGYTPLKDVAARQGISPKYMEKILPVLTKNGYVEGIHGKGGGYRFVKDPAQCPVWDILRVTEGDMAPVACMETGAENCQRQDCCSTVKMWRNFTHLVHDYFDSITIADLMDP